VHTSLPACPPADYRLIQDAERLADALDALKDCTILGLDTETTGLDPLTDRLRLLQLAAPGWPVFVLDLWQIPEEAREPLRQFLMSPSLVTIFHNAKFDLQFLRQAGLQVQGRLVDTMLASSSTLACIRAAIASRTSSTISCMKSSRKRSSAAIGAER
jgi:DNA polymerase I